MVVHTVSLVCSMAMSFYSVSFFHEGMEECLGHQRVGKKASKSA